MHDNDKAVAERVTDTHIRAYQADGAIKIPDMFDARWLDVLAAGIQRNLDNPGWQSRRYTEDRGHQSGFFFGDAGVWQQIPEYRDFLFYSPAAEVAARLTGASKLNLYFDGVFVRGPNTPSRTPWHQDVPYWPIEGDQMCSIWVSLDHVPRADAVEFVRGSHHWNKVFKPKSFFSDKQDYEFRDGGLEIMPDWNERRDETELIGWPMAPGDALCFHGYVIHGSSGNTTDDWRRTFQARYSGDDMTYVLREGEMHPTFPDCDLSDGAPIGGSTFPLVWTRTQGLLGDEHSHESRGT